MLNLNVNSYASGEIKYSIIMQIYTAGRRNYPKKSLYLKNQMPN